MAASIGNPQTSSHVRSTSLPCDTHPLFSSAEDQLQRLKSSQEASASSCASSLCRKLEGLNCLYQSVNDMLQVSVTQEDMDILDGSLRLLDICSSARDVCLQMKECLRDLQSSLRRKRGIRESGIENEVESYMISRKKLIKATLKIFKDLKTMKRRETAPVSKDCVLSLIREVETLSIVVFESLLSFIAQRGSRSKPNEVVFGV